MLGADHPHFEYTLVVRSDSDALNQTLRWLAEAGIEARGTSDFSEARSCVTSDAPPATLVTDLRLRDFNGLHLALLLRERRPRAAVVIIAAFGDRYAALDASACGVNNVVFDSADAARLVGAVRSAVADGATASMLGDFQPHRPFTNPGRYVS